MYNVITVKGMTDTYKKGLANMKSKLSLHEIALELETAQIQLDRIHSLIAVSFGIYDQCPQLDEGYGHYYEAVLYSAMLIGKDVEQKLLEFSDILCERSKEEKAIKTGA